MLCSRHLPPALLLATSAAAAAALGGHLPGQFQIIDPGDGPRGRSTRDGARWRGRSNLPGDDPLVILEHSADEYDHPVAVLGTPIAEMLFHPRAPDCPNPRDKVLSVFARREVLHPPVAPARRPVHQSLLLELGHLPADRAMIAADDICEFNRDDTRMHLDARQQRIKGPVEPDVCLRHQPGVDVEPVHEVGDSDQLPMEGVGPMHIGALYKQLLIGKRRRSI